MPCPSRVARLLVTAALTTTALTTSVFCPPARAATWTPTFDLRVREEVLDGVYHFAGDADRDWIRIRTRLGVVYEANSSRVEVRLDNEHRHLRTPRREPDFDEVIVDRAVWSWHPNAHTALTVGRQDIIWPGGFLVLEGHPLDGSRSIFHDGLRLRTARGAWALDTAFVHNRKRNEAVLIDEVGRDLADADETGLMLRASRGTWAVSLITKFESDPDEALEDLGTTTLGLRHATKSWHFEVAAQHQNGTVRVAADDASARGTGFAFAGEASKTWPLPGGWTAESGGYFYSGLNGHLRPFRTPWGRWPKWSEMYIYSLIGESTPGRVHVAAWEDVAAPRLAVQRTITTRWTESLTLRGVTDLLWSPSKNEARGLLTEVGLRAAFAGGFAAHVLWERLHPGAYHDGRHGLRPIDDPIHLFRWQLAWSW